MRSRVQLKLLSLNSKLSVVKIDSLYSWTFHFLVGVIHKLMVCFFSRREPDVINLFRPSVVFFHKIDVDKKNNKIEKGKKKWNGEVK